MTQWHRETQCSAFAGTRRIANGALHVVAAAVKQHAEASAEASILIFDNHSARPIELDLRGSLSELLASLPPPPKSESEDPSSAPRGPGRPKLGVIAREITLLPRHWDWLNDQPGGASVALRKLVDDARKNNESQDRIRLARENTYRFMHSMTGDQPGFEEASRALFAGEKEVFHQKIMSWPTDCQDYVLAISAEAF